MVGSYYNESEIRHMVITAVNAAIKKRKDKERATIQRLKETLEHYEITEGLIDNIVNEELEL